MKFTKISLEVFICFTILLLTSCNYDSIKSTEIVSTNRYSIKTVSLEDRLTDSLFKYIHLTTFTQRAVLMDTNYVLYGLQIDSSKVGVVAIDGRKLLLFQELRKEIKLVDSFTFTDYARDFKVDDLNGDNRQDFIVYGGWDAHGNNYPYVFLCDIKNILHYRKDLELPNISYDFNKKLVKSFWFGGAYDVHSKGLYRWANDSLEKVAYTELDLTHENMKPAETRLYRRQNGEMLLYKKERDEDGDVFDTALFKMEY